MEVLVVGAGSMGRWLGGILSDCDSPESGVEPAGDERCTVVYYDEQPDVAKRAAAETGGRTVSTPAETYDLVCIAVPIPVAQTAIATHAPRARLAAIDITGTMAGPVEALETHAPNVERASFHPLFSPDNEPGNVPMVVDNEGPVIAFLREVLEDRGNTVFETTPAEHDEAMGTVQARAHAAILAYGLAGEAVPDRFQTTVSSELSELVEQVGDGESRVYADIQEAFDGAADVADAASKLTSADREEFERLHELIREAHR